MEFSPPFVGCLPPVLILSKPHRQRQAHYIKDVSYTFRNIALAALLVVYISTYVVRTTYTVYTLQTTAANVCTLDYRAPDVVAAPTFSMTSPPPKTKYISESRPL